MSAKEEIMQNARPATWEWIGMNPRRRWPARIGWLHEAQMPPLNYGSPRWIQPQMLEASAARKPS